MALNKFFLLPCIIFKLSLLESRSTLNHKTYTTNHEAKKLATKSRIKRKTETTFCSRIF